jgi:PLP dependent protein
VTASLSDATDFGQRLQGIRDRITASATDPALVRFVAVTKGFGPEAVRMAVSAGLTDVGENYADELVAKAHTCDADGVQPTWHFLGAVQRNKVTRLAPVVGWWQGVTRIEEGRSIARRQPGATVLVQVDIAGLVGRGGCDPGGVEGLVARLRCEDLRVAGLMAVGSPGPPEGSRRGFHSVSAMADRLGLPVRSMGMTEDFEVAVSEGSTMVRIGRALFGSRPSDAERPQA